MQPEVVYHLAALSHVGRSWEKPSETVIDNVASAVNVLEAIRHGSPGARVVWVSSCEVYGAPGALPVDEASALAPGESICRVEVRRRSARRPCTPTRTDST